MAFTTLSLGLTLTIPTNGTQNWGTTLFNTTWTKISNHNHTASGDGNQMVTASYSNNSITTAKLSANIGVTQASTLTPVGTTETLNFNLGNVQVIDLGSASGDVTLTLSNSATGSTYLIFTIQGATPRDLIWPASVKWPQGQKLILSQTDDARDYVKMYFDGTNHYVLAWNQDLV